MHIMPISNEPQVNFSPKGQKEDEQSLGSGLLFLLQHCRINVCCSRFFLP